MDTEEFSVIVVGGHEQDRPEPFRQTVEILDPGATEWRAGEDFPLAVKFTSAVTDRHGGIVVIGGLTPGPADLDTMYRLPHSNADSWTLMPQKLSKPTQFSSSFLVGDDLCIRN